MAIDPTQTQLTSSLLAYQAVIFDLYGTLIDFLPIEEYRSADEQMAAALGVPSAGFRRLWLANLHDRNAGVLPTMEDEMLHVCRQLGVYPDAAAVAEANRIRRDITLHNLKPKTRAVETLTALRTLGCRICLLSDCPWEIPALWPQTVFAEFMDSAVFSCDEGTTKPDPAMYAEACRRLGVSPEQCLYVGDGGSSELSGAKSFGMDAILIRTAYGPKFTIYQPEAAVWTGPSISDLSEILDIVSPRQ